MYEAGRITYMRTDSTNLSDVALEAAEKEIASTFGPEYALKRTYASKSKGAQEAHEAIAPPTCRPRALTPHGRNSAFTT